MVKISFELGMFLRKVLQDLPGLLVLHFVGQRKSREIPAKFPARLPCKSKETDKRRAGRTKGRRRHVLARLSLRQCFLEKSLNLLGRCRVAELFHQNHESMLSGFLPAELCCELSGPVLCDTARLSQRYTPVARYGDLGVSTWPIGCHTPSPF